MSVEREIKTPPIVVILRVIGVLCPIAAFVLAGLTNVSDAAGWVMILEGLVLTTLFFALSSIVNLLNRIEKRLSQDTKSAE